MADNTLRLLELDFFKRLGSILINFEKAAPDAATSDQISLLRKRLNIARRSLGDKYLLDDIRPLLIKHYNSIIDRNTIATLNIASAWRSSSNPLNNGPTKENDFMLDVLIRLREQFLASSAVEQEIIYMDVLELLRICTEHGLAQ